MRQALWSMALLAAALLCGCFGGTSLTDVDPVPAGTLYHGERVLGVISAENRGMFLFNCIPLWSGDPEEPNFRQYRMFRNCLKPGYMDRMLKAEGRRLGAARLMANPCTEHSSGWFSLWIVWIRQMRCEAVALGGKGAGK